MSESQNQEFDANSKMFSHEYQKRHIAFQRRYAEKATIADTIMAECCRHLVHGFTLIICLSLIGMIYAIDTEGSDLAYDKEIQSQETMFKSILRQYPQLGTVKDLEEVDAHLKGHYAPVHPLYAILQSKSPFRPDYQIPSFDMSLEENALSRQEFYHQFLSKSLPVILKNECKTWRLYTAIKEVGSDKHDAFINDLFRGSLSHTAFSPKQYNLEYTRLTKKQENEPFQQGLGQAKNITGNYEEFTKERNKLSKNKHMVYVQNWNLNKSPLMMKSDLYQDNFMTKLLQRRSRKFTQWSNFKRKPQKLFYESHICVVRGTETFRFASPIFRKHMYVGAYPHLKKDESPLDFFHLNEKQQYQDYPTSREVTFITVKLTAGDCVFVPAFYYIQSKTEYGEESIIITEEYHPHSQLMEIVLNALEADIPTDEGHSYDKRLNSMLNHMF